MTDKTDPICGMKGKIKAHGHYFCSQDCIKKYEDKLHPPLTKKKWYKAILYSEIALLLLFLVGLLQISGYTILFMGIFFIVVSLLKFADWKGFSNAFAMYDIVAKRSRFYAYVYPLIELAIGISFLLSLNLIISAIVTFLIMAVGSIGVAKNLFSKNPVKCACLGTKIKLPLTQFTFIEDIIMALMAAMILVL